MLFPLELYRAGARTLFGQELRVTYDAAGNVTRIEVVGRDTFTPRPQPTPDAGEADNKEPTAVPVHFPAR